MPYLTTGSTVCWRVLLRNQRTYRCSYRFCNKWVNYYRRPSYVYPLIYAPDALSYGAKPDAYVASVLQHAS